MFKVRELFIEGNKDNGDIKTKIMLESYPKEFFGRKVKTTPDIAFNFIQRNINTKKAVILEEE